MENINQIPNLQPIEPISPVKNKNIFKILFFIFLGLFLITLSIIACFLFNYKKIKPQLSNQIIENIVSTTIPTISESTDDRTKPDQIFNYIYQQFKNENGLSKSSGNGEYVDYIDDSSKWDYAVPTEQLFTADINLKDKIYKKIENTLIENNFKLVPTSSLIGNNVQIEVKTYQLGKTKCVIRIDDNFKFGCFDDSQFLIAYNQQFWFLNAANSNMKNGYKFGGLIYNIKIVGDEALGMYHGGSVDGAIYLYRPDTSREFWQLIAISGSDMLACSQLEKNNIPVNHWPDCVENDSNLKETLKNGTFKIKESHNNGNLYKFSQE